MAGHPVRRHTARSAVNQSAKVICERSQHGFPTAITVATRVIASLPTERSRITQGRRDLVETLARTLSARYASCVDGSELASTFSTSAALVGAAMCSEAHQGFDYRQN